MTHIYTFSLFYPFKRRIYGAPSHNDQLGPGISLPENCLPFRFKRQFLFLNCDGGVREREFSGNAGKNGWQNTHAGPSH